MKSKERQHTQNWSNYMHGKIKFREYEKIKIEIDSSPETDTKKKQ